MARDSANPSDTAVFIFFVLLHLDYGLEVKYLSEQTISILFYLAYVSANLFY